MNIAGRAKTQAWMLLLVVFLLGGITGGAVDRFLFLKQQAPTSTPRGERRRGQMHEFLKRELNLTDEQATSVKTIFENMRKEFPSRFNECPGMKESRDKMRAHIRAILTPEQQTKYDELNARRDAEIQERNKQETKAEEKK
jgi:Spy/CpxP family protein refolding chaperone